MHTPRSGAALGTVAMPVVVWRWTGDWGGWGAAGGLVCFQAGGRGSSHRW